MPRSPNELLKIDFIKPIVPIKSFNRLALKIDKGMLCYEYLTKRCEGASTYVKI